MELHHVEKRGWFGEYLAQLIVDAIMAKIEKDKKKAAATKVESSITTAEAVLKLNISTIADALSAAASHQLNITHLMEIASSRPKNATDIVVTPSKANMTDADAARLAELWKAAGVRNVTELSRIAAAAKHNSTASAKGKCKDKRGNIDTKIEIIPKLNSTAASLPRLWHDINSTRLPCDPFVLNVGNDCIHGVNFTALLKSDDFQEYLQTKGYDVVSKCGGGITLPNPTSVFNNMMETMFLKKAFDLAQIVWALLFPKREPASDKGAAGNKTTKAGGTKTSTALNYTITATPEPRNVTLTVEDQLRLCLLLKNGPRLPGKDRPDCRRLQEKVNEQQRQGHGQ